MKKVISAKGTMMKRVLSTVLTILMIGGIALAMVGCDEAVPAGGQSGYGVLQGAVTYEEGWSTGHGRTYVLVIYKDRMTMNLPFGSFGEVREVWTESPSYSDYEVTGLPPGEYLVIFVAKGKVSEGVSFYDKFLKYKESGLFSEAELQDLNSRFTGSTYIEKSVSIKNNRTATLDCYFQK